MSVGVVGLVRVTVTSGHQRADLALPGSVAVAELVPELARSLHLLDAETAHGGFDLVTAEGVRLRPSTGLSMQNVHDGSVLSLVAGIDRAHDLIYDDVVEAMADVVEAETQPWSPAAARVTALAAAGIALGLGAFALALLRPDVIAGAASAAVAIVLLTAAIVVARLRAEPEVAVLLSWAATVYAGVAGFVLVEGSDALSWPAVAAFGAAAATSLTACVGIGRLRHLVLPAAITSAVLVVTSVVHTAFDVDPAATALVALVLVVSASGLLPMLAMGATGNDAPQPQDPNVLPDEPAAIDLARVRRGARLGHEVLLAITASVGLLAAIVAPFAVALGVSGTVAAALVAVILMLRTRQFRDRAEVATGLAAGLAAATSVAISIVVIQPDWRVWLAAALAALGAGTVAAIAVPRPASILTGRIAEIIEIIAIVALYPLTVVAIGIVAALRS